jgi:hypothetical protein
MGLLYAAGPFTVWLGDPYRPVLSAPGPSQDPIGSHLLCVSPKLLDLASQPGGSYGERDNRHRGDSEGHQPKGAHGFGRLAGVFRVPIVTSGRAFVESPTEARWSVGGCLIHPV